VRKSRLIEARHCAVIAQDRRSRCDRSMLDDLKRRIGLEPRNNAAASLIEPRPPAIIVIAEVENVGRPPLDRHRLGGRDVIHVGRGHHEIKRLVGVRIVDDVRLSAENPRRKRRPTTTQTAQLHAGRIDQVCGPVQVPAQAAMDLIQNHSQQVAEQRGRIVGYVYAAIEPRSWKELRDEAGFIHDVVVDPAARRAGIATALLEAAFAWLRTRRVPRVVLGTAYVNQAAQRLFTGLGFRPTMIEMTKELGDPGPGPARSGATTGARRTPKDT